MTWQRIDNDTYIDDTLVTCAEYQLFIDEMRKQGKYYQPDHWTSYEFPEGAARTPILGVRHSDALAFCEWLTNREGKEWKFRLPTQKEANAFAMKPLEKNPLGYWVDDNDDFVWIGTIPESPRAFDLAFAFNRDSDRILDFDSFSNPYLALALDRKTKLTRARELALNRAIDLTRARALALDINRTRDIARTLDIDLNINRDIDIDHIRDHALDRVRDLALGLAIDSAINRAVDRDIALVFDIYCDIITLQERIAGRSPAFEGIRLVKERIR